MNDSRRTTLLLSVLASAVFWLAADTFSRAENAPSPIRGGGLGPVPALDILLLVGVLALALYSVARLLRAVAKTPRQRRTRWPLALCILGLVLCEGMDRAVDHIIPTPHHNQVYKESFLRDKLAGNVWRSAYTGPYVSLRKETLVFHGDIAVRYRYWRRWDLWLFVYAPLDVWPSADPIYGITTEWGELRDGIVTWRGKRGYTSRYKLNFENDGLTLDWVHR